MHGTILEYQLGCRRSHNHSMRYHHRPCDNSDAVKTQASDQLAQDCMHASEISEIQSSPVTRYS